MQGLFDDIPDSTTRAAPPPAAATPAAAQGLFDDIPDSTTQPSPTASQGSPSAVPATTPPATPNPPAWNQTEGSHAPDSGGMTWRASMFPIGEDEQGNLAAAWPGALHALPGIVKDAAKSILHTGSKIASGQDPRQTGTTEDVLNFAGFGGGAPGRIAIEGAAPVARDAALQAAARLPEVGSLPRAIATDNTPTQMLGGGLQKLPLIGDPLQDAAQQTSENLGKAAARTAADAGNGYAQSEFGGGSAAKEGLKDWITQGSKEIIGKGYDELDKLVSPKAAVPLTNTKAAVKSLTDLDTMSASEDGQKVIKLVQAAVDRPEGLTYPGLKELRTRIGERVFGDIAPEQGTSARALDMLYGSLSKDLRVAVKTAGTAKYNSSGKKAIAAFDSANQVAAQTFAVRKQLKSIIGSEANSPPERVLDNMTKMASTKGNADILKLQEARKAIGDNWGDVASAVVGQLGRDPDKNFSPARFLTDFGKLSDSGKNVLFGDSGALRQSLEDIHTVSQKFMGSSARFTNSSNTGTAVATIGGIKGMMTEPLTALATAIGGRTLSWVLARPVTAKAASGWTRAYVNHARSPNAATAVVLKQASAQLTNAINRENGGGQ